MSDIKKQVFDAIDSSWEDELAFLKSLIACKSTLFNEQGVQQVMARKLKQLGLFVDMFDADIHELSSQPGFSPVEWGYKDRPQVVGVWKSEKSGKGKSLVLNGHADVVSEYPVSNWTYEPYNATIVGDRMYGRGAGDMKCGLAAIVYAITALKKLGVTLDGDVIVQSVIEEECSGNGALACITRGYTGDAALLAECSDQRILTTQQGTLWLRTVVKGSAGHVEGIQPSVNAIDKAYEVMAVLKELAKEWNANPHPAYKDVSNPINISTGIIKGGDWPSSVPAECEFVTRIGLYPDIDPSDAQKTIIEYLHKKLDKDPWFSSHFPEFTWYGFRNAGFHINPDNDFFKTIGKAHKEIMGKPVEFYKIKACTDARFWVLYKKIPATCYGAIGANFHGPDEYVDLPSLKETTKVIASVIMDWCNQNK